MNDYLELYKRFKEIKDIADFIDDVEKLRQYFRTQHYKEMQEHIANLMNKYFFETVVWNAVNRDKPTNDTQSCINAENFLCVQGAKLIVEKVVDYKKGMSEEEIAFIESMIKPME